LLFLNNEKGDRRMKGKIKATIITATLLAMLLIAPLFLGVVIAPASVTGTQDDTSGVWLFNAGTTVPAGAPTDDIIDRAIFYDILDYIGDTTEEVYDFGYGPSEPTTGQEDKTLAEVIQGLSSINDFGYIANSGDDAANFDTGKNGYFLGGYDPAIQRVIVPDGVPATGTLGPSEAPTKEQADAALDGCELFIFEDAELSGMIITLSNDLGLSITFSLADLQVDPPTPNAADDTLIAIDLDTLAGFDGTYIDTIRIQDDGIYCPRTNTGDTTLEIDAIATRSTESTLECTVNFFTKPSTIGNITFMGVTYVNGETEIFLYGTSGLATANAPEGWVFDHWEIVGNVQVSSTTANPTTFTITCGGNLTAVFRQLLCPVVFFTVPSAVGNITFEGETYTNGQGNTFTYGTSGLATANAPEGWVFDHWEIVGNVQVSSTTANPTTFTITCGGNLTAVFRQGECISYPPVAHFTAPSACVGQAITFNASSSLGGYDGDDPTDITQYHWDFDGDGVVDLIALTDTVMWGYAEAGEYNVTLTVYAPGIPPHICPDYIDNDTTQQTVTIVEPIPPVALFTEDPETPKVNEIVMFNATDSQPGFDGFSIRPIIWYFWDFGDGHAAKETGPITTHVYTEPGNYNVTLTVYAPAGPNGCPCYKPYATTWHIKIVLRDGCEIVLYPIEDSWVGSKCSYANHGTDDELYVETIKTWSMSAYEPLCCCRCHIKRTYLKFNVSVIPSDTKIIHARLYLAVTKADSNPYVEVVIHKTGDNWSEYTITWNNAPIVGDFVSTNTTVNGVCQYYSWNVTSYVQGEISGDGIISLVAKFPNDDLCTNDYLRVFGSKEHSNASKRPYLKIWFECKPDYPNGELNKNTASTEQILSLATLTICLLALTSKALPYLANSIAPIKSGKKGILRKHHDKHSPNKKT
jgi:hypothetical protein